MASGLPLTEYSMPYLASFFDIMSNVQRLMHSMPTINYPTSAYDHSCVIEQTFMRTHGNGIVFGIRSFEYD